jgi:DNA-directed RNA polymerase alpha subunit
MIVKAVLEYASEQLKRKFQVALQNNNRDMAHAQVDYAFEQIVSDDHTPLAMAMPADLAFRFEEAGIYTIEEVCCYTRDELLTKPDIGPWVISELEKVLKNVDLSLRKDDAKR